VAALVLVTATATRGRPPLLLAALRHEDLDVVQGVFDHSKEPRIGAQPVEGWQNNAKIHLPVQASQVSQSLDRNGDDVGLGVVQEGEEFRLRPPPVLVIERDTPDASDPRVPILAANRGDGVLAAKAFWMSVATALHDRPECTRLSSPASDSAARCGHRNGEGRGRQVEVCGPLASFYDDGQLRQ
jgi:hypothetical protein